ncbi:DUF262 domain-containing protein [Gordonia sp. CPCC 206044]|uniref:GmrSD restriction endonuclease domain-containing protein n=1 Tax=Gordonia sp. CPCC 206044 TaxID=3140793 RepID=UPI003AF3CEFE
MDIFIHPQHFVIPLFQRPYVWEQEDQWAPLWGDVRRLAELWMKEPHANPTHFLGAIVVQAQVGALGNLQIRNVIDGQQRLTTLQLLMDAASGELAEIDAEQSSAQLEKLTHNDTIFVRSGESQLKIRHSNKDRAAFEEVMSADIPIGYGALEHTGALVVRAHEYFASEIRQWLAADNSAGRARALVYVLSQGIQLVTIDLTAAENSQEIFETLNARGTPLTAADLIRNYVFQRVEADGGDTRKAYSHDWPFETGFWQEQVSVGRYTIGRSSLFLNQWLVSRTGDEIGPRSTFNRFKSYVEHESPLKMQDLLPVIKEQAALYEQWTLAAQDPTRQLGAVEKSVYRMQVARLELLKPLLIWLHEPGRSFTPATIGTVVRYVESWVMRRLLLRLSGSDLGRIVADLVNEHRDVPDSELTQRVSGFLSRLNVTSTYWPADAEIRESLRLDPVYQRLRPPRLRMVLEAIEDRYRAETGESQIERKGYPIEHILPQSWHDHWYVDDPEAQMDRAEHVHRLGNLTLLTAKLNPKVSNSSWSSKRAAFLKHNTINLTGRLLTAEQSEWDEFAIDSRTDELIDVLLAIWPVPEGHQGVVVDPQAKANGWVEIKHLLAAGLLRSGDQLVPRPGQYVTQTATILEDGKIEVDGQRFSSPSGAAAHIRGGSTNGWKFWRVADGRQLEEVRDRFTGQKPETRKRFDWSPLHTILERLPEGYWTTYGDLADAVGTSPQPVGNHVTGCRQCSNAYRILRNGGAIADGFVWHDADDRRDVISILESEGLSFAGGRADPARHLGSQELLALDDFGREEEAGARRP